MVTKARLLLQRDEDPRVRTAAFAGALATLSAWWNAAQQSEQAVGLRRSSSGAPEWEREKGVD